MDRVNGARTVDIGGGKRGFRSQNRAAGINGTEVTATFLNDVQENLAAVIEGAGLALAAGDWTLLRRAIARLAVLNVANVPVLGVLSSPPGAPADRAQYLVGAAPTGLWAARVNQIARWLDGAWSYEVPQPGKVVTYWSGVRQVQLAFNGAAWVEDMGSEATPGRLQLASKPIAVAGINEDRPIHAAGLNAAMEQFGLFGNSFHCVQGVDADTLRFNGFFWASGATNTPDGAGSWLIVVHQVDNVFIRQTAYAISSNLVFTRLFAGGWTIWGPMNADATTDYRGLVELATVPETQALVDALRAVTPAGLAGVQSQLRAYDQVLYPNAGSFIWTAPANVRRLLVELWGGGAGGGGSAAGVAGGGGGAGGYARKWIPVVPGTNYGLYVGAAGTPGTPTASGGNGGTSSLGVISATGGGGGGSGNGNPGVGGNGFGGDIVRPGGNGGQGVFLSGSTIPLGGFGAPAYLGTIIPTNGKSGVDAYSFGGGGSGSAEGSGNGGAGRAGAVILSY